MPSNLWIPIPNRKFYYHLYSIILAIVVAKVLYSTNLMLLMFHTTHGYVNVLLLGRIYVHKGMCIYICKAIIVHRKAERVMHTYTLL